MKRTGPLKRCTAVVLLLVAVTLLGGCGAQQFKTDIFQDFYSIGWGPTAMTWSGRDLLIGDETIVMELISIDTGTYIGETYPYNNNGFFNFSRQPQTVRSVGKISGLAWEADCCGSGFLWVSDPIKRQILKLSASYEVLKAFATDGFVPQGLAFDGKDLWTADAANSRLYKISIDSGKILQIYVSPIARPLGLAFDCNHLYVLGLDDCKAVSSDCSTKRLVKIDMETLRVIEEITLPKQVKRPVSIASANDTLWIGDRVLNRVFKVSNRGDAVEGPSPLMVAKAPEEVARPRKIEVVERPFKEEASVSPEDSKKVADEAKKAADEAKKAADEAKKAAEQAKKAFELQQKK